MNIPKSKDRKIKLSENIPIIKKNRTLSKLACKNFLRSFSLYKPGQIFLSNFA